MHYVSGVAWSYTIDWEPAFLLEYQVQTVTQYMLFVFLYCASQ